MKMNMTQTSDYHWSVTLPSSLEVRNISCFELQKWGSILSEGEHQVPFVRGHFYGCYPAPIEKAFALRGPCYSTQGPGIGYFFVFLYPERMSEKEAKSLYFSKGDAMTFSRFDNREVVE